MEVPNNINDKIINQLNSVLIELERAKSNTYTSLNIARQNISKAEGIIETIKVLIE
jgi:hypothetical protein